MLEVQNQGVGRPRPPSEALGGNHFGFVTASISWPETTSFQLLPPFPFGSSPLRVHHRPPPLCHRALVTGFKVYPDNPG